MPGESSIELADLARAGKAPPAPLAVEAVRQIDAIFAHERAINGRDGRRPACLPP